MEQKTEQMLGINYTIILSCILIGSAIIMMTLSPIMLNVVYNDETGIRNVPTVSLAVSTLIFVLLGVGIFSILLRTIIIGLNNKWSAMPYGFKKFNNMLYNILLLSITNLSFGILEITLNNNLILGVVAIFLYTIPGYLVLTNLFKIALQDIYMALVKPRLAKDVKA